MYTFIISLIVLLVASYAYGKLIERFVHPDAHRKTPC